MTDLDHRAAVEVLTWMRDHYDEWSAFEHEPDGECPHSPDECCIAQMLAFAEAVPA